MVLSRMGQTQQALERQQAALQQLEETPDAEVEARLHFGVARALSFLGRTDAALVHAEKAAVLSAQHDVGDVLGLALQLKGSLLVESQGRAVEGIALLRAAARHLELLSGAEHSFDLAGTKLNLGDALCQSDSRGSYEVCLEAIALLERLGSETAGLARGNLALVNLYAGRWEEARQSAVDALKVARAEDARAVAALATAMVAALTGDADRAHETLAGMDASAVDDRQVSAVQGVARAALLLAEGSVDEAKRTAAEASRSAYSDLGMRTDAFRFGWPIALEAAVATGDLAEADSLQDLVARAPKGVVPPFLRAELAHYRALIRAARGEHDSVESDFREALETLTQLDYPFWVAKVQSDLARWLENQGRDDEASPLLEQAARAFTELGAWPDLERRGLRSVPVSA
jgi:tetratricopeptide (TPR) repeat protein